MGTDIPEAGTAQLLQLGPSTARPLPGTLLGDMGCRARPQHLAQWGLGRSQRSSRARWKGGWGSDRRARESRRGLQERRGALRAALAQAPGWPSWGGPEAPIPEPHGPDSRRPRGRARIEPPVRGLLLRQHQDADRAQCLDSGERVAPMGAHGARGEAATVPATVSSGHRPAPRGSVREERGHTPSRVNHRVLLSALGHRAPHSSHGSRIFQNFPHESLPPDITPKVPREAALGPFSRHKPQPDSEPSVSASRRSVENWTHSWASVLGCGGAPGGSGCRGGLAAGRGRTPCSRVRHAQGITKHSLEHEQKCKGSQGNGADGERQPPSAGGRRTTGQTGGRAGRGQMVGRGEGRKRTQQTRAQSPCGRGAGAGVTPAAHPVPFCGPQRKRRWPGARAWWSPRGHGVTSVNSRPRTLRQLHKTWSELDVWHACQKPQDQGHPKRVLDCLAPGPPVLTASVSWGHPHKCPRQETLHLPQPHT